MQLLRRNFDFYSIRSPQLEGMLRERTQLVNQPASCRQRTQMNTSKHTGPSVYIQAPRFAALTFLTRNACQTACITSTCVHPRHQIELQRKAGRHTRAFLPPRPHRRAKFNTHARASLYGVRSGRAVADTRPYTIYVCARPRESQGNWGREKRGKRMPAAAVADATQNDPVRNLRSLLFLTTRMPLTHESKTSKLRMDAPAFGSSRHVWLTILLHPLYFRCRLGAGVQVHNIRSADDAAHRRKPRVEIPLTRV